MSNFPDAQAEAPRQAELFGDAFYDQDRTRP